MKKAVLACVAFLIAFCCVDSILRIIMRHSVKPELDMFVNDPDIGANVHVPNSVTIGHWRGTPPHRVSYNSFGFRGPNPKKNKKEPGVVRILTLGGSSTEAAFVEDGKTWSEVLQRELDKVTKTSQVEVINLGTGGYSSPMIIKNFRKRGLPLRPDIVILYEANNDFFGPYIQHLGSSITTDESFVDYENRSSSMLEQLFCKSIIIDQINRHLYYKGGARNRAYLDDYWRDPCKTNLSLDGIENYSTKPLQSLYDMSLTNGFTIIVGRQASLVKSALSRDELCAMWEILRMRYKGVRLTWNTITEGLTRVKDAQKSFALNHGLEYLDIESAVPKDLAFFIDHVHYTPKGEEAVGQAFAHGIVSCQRLRRILGMSADCLHQQEGVQDAYDN